MSGIEQHALVSVAPDGFVPEEVIVRTLAPAGTPWASEYRDIDVPTRIGPDFPGIARFAETVAAGDYKPNEPSQAEDNPLSIPVYRDSYIILQLSSDVPDWQFCAGSAAITLGASASGGMPLPFYGDLNYVARGKAPSTVPVPGCKLLYFSARFAAGTPERPYRQKFNILVDLAGGITVLIDPDVRHPGGFGN